MVIDHHPPRPDLAATFLDVRAEEGCCTTMLLGYHQALGLELDPDVATAAAYAIISETQDLEREATQADRLAYQRLIPLVRLTTLGRIRHPARERAYYRTIARAMQHVALAKNTCVCHIGRVPYPEVVAEVADFLVAMKHVTWCLVSGLHEDSMAVSLRTTHPNAQADQVMKRILGDEGKGGGHSTMAGGALPCASEELYRERSTLLVERLVQQLSLRPSTRFRPLLGDDEDRVDQTGTPFRVKE